MRRGCVGGDGTWWPTYSVIYKQVWHGPAGAEANKNVRAAYRWLYGRLKGPYVQLMTSRLIRGPSDKYCWCGKIFRSAWKVVCFLTIVESNACMRVCVWAVKAAWLWEPEASEAQLLPFCLYNIQQDVILFLFLWKKVWNYWVLQIDWGEMWM